MVRLKADDPGHALGCQVHSNEAAFRSQEHQLVSWWPEGLQAFAVPVQSSMPSIQSSKSAVHRRRPILFGGRMVRSASFDSWWSVGRVPHRPGCAGEYPGGSRCRQEHCNGKNCAWAHQKGMHGPWWTAGPSSFGPHQKQHQALCLWPRPKRQQMREGFGFWWSTWLAGVL